MNYIGKIRYTANNKLKLITSSLHNQIVQGQHAPIIDEALWSKVQQSLSQRSRPPNKTIERYYPLSGLLKCPLCAQSMVPFHCKSYRKDGSSRINHYYVCSNYINRGSICKANSIPASAVEHETLLRFQGILTGKNLLNQVVSRVNQKAKESYEPLQKQLTQFDIELKEIEKRRKRCFELFEDGHIEHPALIEKINLLEENMLPLKAIKHQIQLEIEKHQNKSVALNEIHEAINSFIQTFHTIEISKQNALLRGFIESIYIPPSRDLSGIQIQGTTLIKHLTI